MAEFRILLFMVTMVVVSLILERSFYWARSFSAALLCICLGIVCGNVGIIPHQSVVYDGIFTYLVPMAIFFLLLHVDFREIKKAGPQMLLAFAIGASTVVVGVLVGTWMFKSMMGDVFWQMAGLFTGTYIGGGVNYVGVGTALDVNPTLLAAGAAADNLTTAIWMIVCITAPRIFLKSKHINKALAKKFERRQEVLSMTLESFAALIGLGIFAYYVSYWLHQWIAFVPTILWITVLSLGMAQFEKVQEYKGSEILGSFTVLLFFVTLGAICDVREMLHVGVYLFGFTLVIVFVHGVLLVGLGKLLKFPPSVMILVSQACIGGAPSAVSLAKILGLKKYLASTALVGILGYAVGNFVGVLMAYAIKAWG